MLVASAEGWVLLFAFLFVLVFFLLGFFITDSFTGSMAQGKENRQRRAEERKKKYLDSLK